MTCHSCGKTIESLSDYGQKHECRSCYNKRHRSYDKREYMREYGKARRWLNGTDRRDDMGPKADTYLVNFYDSGGLRFSEVRDKKTRRQMA